VNVPVPAIGGKEPASMLFARMIDAFGEVSSRRLSQVRA
jgi:hypothetical protein